MSDVAENSVTLNELAEQSKRLFTERYGRSPTWLVAAPGRVNMIGDHVDYNDGWVLPFAIDRYTAVAGALTTSSTASTTVHSVALDKSYSTDLHSPIVPINRDWSNYVNGVMHGFVERGVELPSMDLLIHTSIPTGSGLSSSAALEVAVATMLETATGTILGKQEKALLCQKAEHDFAKVPCGVMDQFISVFGKEDSMLLLDCQDLSTRQVAFDAEKLGLVVVNSNVEHELGESEYAIRRQTCESAAEKLGLASLRDLDLGQFESSRERISETEFLRAKHVVTENDRTLRFVDAISNGDFVAAGKLLFASHDSLRDDFAVSCEELNQLVEISRDIGVAGGVYGARMTGGGFGGSMIVLVDKESASDVANQIVATFNHARQSDQQPVDAFPVNAFLTQPSRGAHEL